MKTRRRLLTALVASALAAPFASLAQQPAAKLHRIGFLGTAFASGYVREVDWVRAGLRKLGYEEGRNIVIEYRWAEGNPERIREIAAEFVALKLDAILVHGLPGAIAAARETSTIPIVMADGADPVAAGLAASLARPGGNVTGSTSFVPEESAKRLELLKEVVPRIRRVAFLISSLPPPTIAITRKALDAAAASMKVELREFVVREGADLPDAFKAMTKARMDAAVINNEPLLNSHAGVIAALASVMRLPAVGYPSFADAGGLLAYGANRAALYGRAGYFLDRIFKGAAPRDIPFERAAKFDLIVNSKTAKALGVAMPQAVRMRADKVIE
jgi:putative ABC transport system substrate-binding protein